MAEPPARRLEPWPLALAGLLLAMMATSLGFWAVAAAHPDPLVVDDAYRAGLRYNDELQARRRAEALGVELDLELRPDPEGIHVAVSIAAPDGPVSAERVVLRRERPAEGGFDADFELLRRDGAWIGHVPLPRPGRWQLVASASLRGETLQRRFGIWR